MRGSVAILALAVAACSAAVTNPVAPPPPSVAAAPPPVPVVDYEDLGPTLRKARELAPRLDEAARRRIQILVAIPGPTMRRLGFRVDAEYYYPASAVKLCTAVAAAEKLEELRIDSPELSLDSQLRVTDSWMRPPLFVTTLRAEIEKSLIVSDNDSYNRLFDFVGRDDLNARMNRLALRSARLAHRFGVNPDREPPMIEIGSLTVGNRLLDPPPLYEVPGILVGSSHVDASGRVVQAPFDFTEKNRISLRDLQDLLVDVVRPDLATNAPRFAEADRRAIVDILAKTPSELAKRSQKSLDDLHNPIRSAVMSALPGHKLRVYEKGGRAYGFTIANAYVEDQTTGHSLFLTATIHTSESGRINGDRYEYIELADPFIARLGALIARTYL